MSRINRLYDLTKNPSPFSSIADYKRSIDKLLSVEASESTLPSIEETRLSFSIDDGFFTRLVAYIYETDLYDIPLSDEEFKLFKKFEKDYWPTIIENQRIVITNAEKIHDNELQEAASERKRHLAKYLGSLKKSFFKIIQRENIRRQNIPDENNLESEIVEVSRQIKDTENLGRVWELFSGLKKKLESGEFSEAKQKVFMETFVTVIDKFVDFSSKEWRDKKINFTDEELEILEKDVKAVLDNIAKILPEEFPLFLDSNYRSRTEKDLKKFEKNLITERTSRGISGNNRRDDDSELDKQITTLKSQIKVLEEKIKNTPDSDNNKQQYRSQIQQLQLQLKEKENQQQDKNDFPWKWVFGIGGGIVIILVIVLLIKKIFKN